MKSIFKYEMEILHNIFILSIFIVLNRSTTKVYNSRMKLFDAYNAVFWYKKMKKVKNSSIKILKLFAERNLLFWPTIWTPSEQHSKPWNFEGINLRVK